MPTLSEETTSPHRHSGIAVSVKGYDSRPTNKSSGQARWRKLDATPTFRHASRQLFPGAQLNHFPPLFGRRPLHPLPERAWYVKLNYDGHNSLPMPALISLTDLVRSAKVSLPCHSHPHSHLTESDNRSFFRSALHTAHDRIHMMRLHTEYCADWSTAVSLRRS